MSAHTPGPWVAKHAADISGDIGIVGDGGCVAECFHEIRKSYEGAYAECLANARLIAAAPDLLKALQRIVNNPEARIGGDIRAEANAAINKAIGNAAPEGLAPLLPAALAAARAFGAGLDDRSLEQPSEVL